MNVSRTSSQDSIKNAFKTLAPRLHPDKNNAPDATAQFQRLGAAYEVLQDPVSRTQYDRYWEKFQGQAQRQQEGYSESSPKPESSRHGTKQQEGRQEKPTRLRGVMLTKKLLERAKTIHIAIQGIQSSSDQDQMPSQRPDNNGRHGSNVIHLFGIYSANSINGSP